MIQMNEATVGFDFSYLRLKNKNRTFSKNNLIILHNLSYQRIQKFKFESL